MKKIKLLMLGALLFGTIGLAACNKKNKGEDKTDPGGEVKPDDPTPGDDPQPAGSVTVYLDLGSIGLYEGKKGEDFPEVNVSNGVKITGKPGDALPGKDKITSTSGATFVSWMVYENTGAPVAYSVLPNYNTVLLANWSGGSGTLPPDGEDDPQPEDEITYTLTNSKGWDVFKDNAKVYSWAWGGNLGDGKWIACTKISEKDLAFTCDKTATGCKIVRFADTVSEPDWKATIWNQSGDITLNGSTTAVNYSIGD